MPEKVAKMHENFLSKRKSLSMTSWRKHRWQGLKYLVLHKAQLTNQVSPSSWAGHCQIPEHDLYFLHLQLPWVHNHAKDYRKLKHFQAAFIYACDLSCQAVNQICRHLRIWPKVFIVLNSHDLREMEGKSVLAAKELHLPAPSSCRHIAKDFRNLGTP